MEKLKYIKNQTEKEAEEYLKVKEISTFVDLSYNIMKNLSLNLFNFLLVYRMSVTRKYLNKSGI